MTNLYNCNYLPIPPRAWSRVENRCTYDTTTNDGYDPLIFQRIAQINKGNVLQYKKNSSHLTKNQRYTQIVKGLWTNRTKSWATQSETYTNPNTSSLKRVGYTEYPINDITPGTPVNPAGPFQPVVQVYDPNCPNLTYKDGGNLVCGTYQNPCTGKVIEEIPRPNYYPTSDSDVPGPIQLLYWDPRIQTWYPKVQRTMNNSTDKWPINYKFFKSAIQVNAPVLSIISSTVNSVELSWIIQNNSIPANKFTIFVNNSLYKTIINSINYTTNLTNLPEGPYEIYIVAFLSTNSSPPSNIVIYNNEIFTKTTIYEDSTDTNTNDNTNDNTNQGSIIFNNKSDYYVIENINNNSNAIFLPDYLISENNKTITIVNKTTDILTILSTAPIYNIMYAPNGTHALEIMENGTATLRYIYDIDNKLTIHAIIT